MKYAPYIGALAAILLITACFMPWTYYPDIHQTFNGFYSHQDNYGKPGKAFIFLAVFSIILFFIPKIWAKRVGQITAVIILAYAIKTFILFSSCYAGICPEKKPGIFLVLLAALFILAASLFTGVKLPEESKNQ
ncbi:MAG: hypothetical protein ABIY90_02085 [Puia sp.]